MEDFEQKDTAQEQKPEGDARPYKPGELVSLEVEGYEEPFGFRVSVKAYQKLMRTRAKEMHVAVQNLLVASSTEPERLKPLLDEDSEQYDMTLYSQLANGLMEGIGLAREVTVKKHSTSPQP